MATTSTHEIDAPQGACHVLARVHELSDWIARRSADIERDRRVPDDVVDVLAAAGCMRMVVGAEHGGDGLPLAAAMQVIEELSRANGSIGWLIGQVTLGHVVFGYLPPQAAAEVYAGGPDVYAAGAAAPKGHATATPDGWQVSGRWPLVSGCRRAAWLYLQCLVTDDGAPRLGANGIPQMLTVVVPAREIRILETFRGLGLRASGSHDVHARALHCPAVRACDLTAAPVARAPIMRVPVATQAGLVAAAVMLGTAAGALDAIATLAAQKRPSFSMQRLAESTLFQRDLGEASMTLAAARALLLAELADFEDQAARAARGPDDGAQARLRAAGVKSALLAAAAVDVAYTLGGSSSVPDGAPLERRLRDARTLTQHATLSRDHYAGHGAALASAAAPLNGA